MRLRYRPGGLLHPGPTAGERDRLYVAGAFPAEKILTASLPLQAKILFKILSNIQ